MKSRCFTRNPIDPLSTHNLWFTLPHCHTHAAAVRWLMMPRRHVFAPILSRIAINLYILVYVEKSCALNSGNVFDILFLSQSHD